MSIQILPRNSKQKKRNPEHIFFLGFLSLFIDISIIEALFQPVPQLAHLPTLHPKTLLH